MGCQRARNADACTEHLYDHGIMLTDDVDVYPFTDAKARQALRVVPCCRDAMNAGSLAHSQ